MFHFTSYTTLEKLELLNDYQETDVPLIVFADYKGVRPANLSNWIRQFLLSGLLGLLRPKHNHRYSLQTKLKAVEAYRSGKYSSPEILNQYNIRNASQLSQWIIQYNMGKLDVAYATRKRVRKMGRKVSFDEKKEIVQWTLDHQRNYQAAAEKYNVSYQRVYSWVHKYSNSQDWQALRDNRGRNKGKEASSEVERLRQRVRELEREKREREVEINFAKKLIEIHNRGVQRPDDIKRFRK